ncbi:metallophosphoesterase [Salmonella enterica subsp. enterica serovar Gatineau]|uniref:metallophosphoesterase n=1 Tax=Salmonella enterica TaxID=28901 RepID=UPI001288ED5B|nr:metallophosphoesterase [Salmonella enterica]ECG1479948.1 metallophosphoesterase [Salmonella enterica subsp. enterica]MDR7936161.1 metallophosphoesterase [Salmonella enterica subsp. enterica serovar Gatineau]
MLILHLSDIHFRKSEIQTAQDPNFHLRNELIRDAAQKCARIGVPDVVIVSGDIAFSGDPEEFSFATDWLERLCEACHCSMASVFVVPGNHDVVRNLADRNLVQMIHRTIKSAPNPNAEIMRQLSDPDARRLLYESLDNYNQFAQQFFCDLLPPNRTRVVRDLVLNDGSTLRLWGLNSSFVSSSYDSPGELFVDPASFQITREDGVVNAVITHHHLTWLGNARGLEDHLNDVAPLQIFGHIHTNRVDMVRDYVRLAASAMNPDRHEDGWEPGYNLIELDVSGEPTRRMLNIRAHIRVWQTAPGGFQAKMDRNSSVFEHSIRLEDWNSSTETSSSFVAQSPPSAHISEITSVREGNSMNTLRELGLRFYRLTFSQKLEIAGRLELLEDDDMRLPDYERFRQVLLRAYERGMLDEFAAAVTEAEQR